MHSVPPDLGNGVGGFKIPIIFSGPQIVNLTGYPRQTVWDRIKRAQKVLGIDGAVFT